ncbi:hypothetical protein [Viridibacterium curvum]|uniref:HMA domain-containing protein n=1 Tax=Viridibacterium curvum TaxID=1101404 RepID=A0ABP9R0N1_9RHOO
MAAALYRIVFTGRIRDGLTLESVRQAVTSRLSASSMQVERIFSGRKVVLKTGLEQEPARTYASRLERLGMVVTVEPVPEASAVASAGVPQPAPAVVVPGKASGAPGTAEETWLTSSGFADLARTQINLARAEALLSGHGGAAPMAEPPIVTAPVDVSLPTLILPVTDPVMKVAAPGEEPPAVIEDIPPKVVKLAPTQLVSPTPATQPGPSYADNHIHLSGTFRCNHCDALHQFEATVQIRLADLHPPRQGMASG